MKLVDLAKKTTNLLQEAGEKGINNIELAEKLKMPRRRVYDIIAILRAVGLVESKREKGGTRIFWVNIPTITSSTAAPAEIKASEKFKAEIASLKDENSDLKDKIKRLRNDIRESGVEKTLERRMFDSSGIVVRAAKSLKITEVVSSGIEVTIKANGKGILVEPSSED
ncbi:MAG: hypothetical protein ACFFD2_05560 [Promethearchaeota archaeon]